jgi:hypothetical protein
MGFRPDGDWSAWWNFDEMPEMYNNEVAKAEYLERIISTMSKKEISGLLEQLFRQAQMQFGSAAKSRWFHDGDGRSGCGRGIDGMKFKGKNALSLNAFIFREHGVLIAYLLCGKCAKQIHRAATNDTLTCRHREKFENKHF